MEQVRAARGAKRHYKTQPKGIDGQQLLKDWRASGLSISAFCVKRKISAATFQYWRKKIEQPGQRSPSSRKQTFSKTTSKPQPKTKRPAFIPVGTVGTFALPRESMFELELRCGRLLRVPMDFDESALKKMLAVLEVEGRAC